MHEINRIVQNFMQRDKTPGVSIATVKDGQFHWAKGYGRRDTSSGARVSKQTVFQACSLSKVITAYAAIQMWIEEGRDFEQPLAKILPHPSLDKNSGVERVTLQMVLSHSSGISHTIRNPAMEFRPGERFSYSSGGFAYLQKVIEHLTEMPFARYVQQNVLEPMGMANSSFIWSDIPDTQIAKSHGNNSEPLLDNRPTETTASCAGSLLSTPSDIARFLEVILRGGHVCDVMMAKQVSVAPGLFWGTGWGIESDPQSGDWGWQWGWSRTGFRNYLAANPAEGTGIIIFTNGIRGYKLWKTLAQKTVGGKHKSIDWVLRDL